MLKIFVPKSEFFDYTSRKFLYSKPKTIYLEHSLLSISKWECKVHKAFFTKNKKTDDELFEYIKCMVIGDVDDLTIRAILNSTDLMKIVNDYMFNPMSAIERYEETDNNTPNNQILYTELIYFSMINYGIPLECEKWHINKLLSLIDVCRIKNTPEKELSFSDVASRNDRLNEERKRMLNTTG